MNQLQQLNEVLRFYQQQLDVIKTQLKQNLNAVTEKEKRASELEHELIAAQQSSIEPMTASNLEFANHLMKLVQKKIGQNQLELVDANAELSRCRIELNKQMSKIDALEKVVSQQIKILEHERRVAEQNIADERYLNTNFS